MKLGLMKSFDLYLVRRRVENDGGGTGFWLAPGLAVTIKHQSIFPCWQMIGRNVYPFIFLCVTIYEITMVLLKVFLPCCAAGQERRGADRVCPGPAEFSRPSVAGSPLGFSYSPEQSPEPYSHTRSYYKEGQTRMNQQVHYIVAGIDVSKATLDLAIANQRDAYHIRYDDEGLALIIEQCFCANVSLVILEATGGLERKLVAALANANLVFHIANPRQVRNLAKATGQLAKTDKIDARVLVDYGLKLQPLPHRLPSKNKLKLHDLSVRHQQLVQMQTAERNRLHASQEPVVADMIEQHLALIDQQIKQVANVMDQLIEQRDELKRKAAVLESACGVGSLTARRLIAELDELGQRSPKQIAKLVGLAPLNRDSGTLRGKRTISGGRRHVRKALYMPTIAAIRHNPVIKRYYQNLITAGKAKKVAINACMRKLLIYHNAMIREN